MRKIAGIIVFVAVLAVPLLAGDVEPTDPINIEKWSIGWDRLRKITIIDATFKNSSAKQVSDLSVVLEFFNDKGTLVKTSLLWGKSYLSGRTETRMKLRIWKCLSFSRYLVKVTGTAGEPFEQIFEGKYWPEKPGDTPAMPQPVVFAKGTADVRVTGSRTEYLKVSRKKEAMRILGTVQNMGDHPAEKVVVTVTLLDKKKAVWTKDVKIKTAELEPLAVAPFSVIVRRLPYHTKIKYRVDFNSVETGEETVTTEKFDVEAGSLVIKDCSIDSKTGLFTGTLINNGGKTVSDIVVNISIEKAGETTLYKIQPGGNIKPGDSLSLIKATMPEFDTFNVNVGFQE